MSENQEVKHITLGKYRVVYEQAASTKGIIGFKVEANGDDLYQCQTDADLLLVHAKRVALETETKAPEK